MYSHGGDAYAPYDWCGASANAFQTGAYGGDGCSGADATENVNGWNGLCRLGFRKYKCPATKPGSTGNKYGWPSCGTFGTKW